MINRSGALKYLAGVLLAAAGFTALMYGFSRLMRPDLTGEFIEYSADQIAKVEALRSTSLDTENPPQLYREVDYSEGESAAWYPKGESPILAELVKEGKLPPVNERVGEEPCVVEGVEGLGKYGGTWMRIATSMDDVNSQMGSRLGSVRLVRWSPEGYPIVPQVAKSFEVSDDSREFTFTLRKGMKWSDGHPFTADDILFWWEVSKYEMDIEGAQAPYCMRIRDQHGWVEFTGPVSQLR